MNSRHIMARAALLVPVAVVWAISSLSAQQNPFLGRWNLTGTGENAANVYWLEITDEGGQLTGRFLNRGGSPVKLQTVKVENGELTFQMPPTQRGPSPEFHARMQGDKLAGSVNAGDKAIEFVGVRPPKWPPANANAPHKFGTPV